MTADDVVFSLKRTVDPATGSFFGSYGKNVASVEATGTNQVTVKLTKADPVFYQMLASPMGQVVKKDYVEAAGKEYGTSASLPMCTGPYRVTFLGARRLHLGGGQSRSGGRGTSS